GVFLFALFYLAALELDDVLPRALTAGLFPLSLLVSAVYFTLLHRGVEALHPLRPTGCSIYDRRVWAHERLWEVLPIPLLHAFDGTPFKSMLWRLLGVRIGSRVFDDGVHLSEPTLTAIGDESILNYE